MLTTSFEDWDPDGAWFDAVVAFNSLHWIGPQLRYAKSARLLAPGAAMAVGGCHWAQPADAGPFRTDVQQDYRAVGYEGDPPPPPEQIGPWHFPAEAGAFFQEVASLRYPFQAVYSTGDYLDILATQSGTRATRTHLRCTRTEAATARTPAHSDRQALEPLSMPSALNSGGQQQGTGSGRIPCQINYATVINDVLGHRTLRLLSAEEAEHPLGEECGGVRVVRRQ